MNLPNLPSGIFVVDVSLTFTGDSCSLNFFSVRNALTAFFKYYFSFLNEVNFDFPCSNALLVYNSFNVDVNLTFAVVDENSIKSLKFKIKDFIEVDENSKETEFKKFAVINNINLVINFTASNSGFNQAIQAINDTDDLCSLVKCHNDYFIKDVFESVVSCCVHRCYTKSTTYCKNEGSCIIDYDANYKPNCKYVFRN